LYFYCIGIVQVLSKYLCRAFEGFLWGFTLQIANVICRGLDLRGIGLKSLVILSHLFGILQGVLQYKGLPIQISGESF